MASPGKAKPIPFSRRRGFFKGAADTTWHAILLQNPISGSHLDTDRIVAEMREEGSVTVHQKNVTGNLLAGRLAAPSDPWVLLAELGTHRWLYVLTTQYSSTPALGIAFSGHGYRTIGAHHHAKTGVVELAAHHGRGEEFLYRVGPNDRPYPAEFDGHTETTIGYASYDGPNFPLSWWKRSKTGFRAAGNLLAEYAAYAPGVAVQVDGKIIRLIVLPGETVDTRSFRRLDLLCLSRPLDDVLSPRAGW